MMFSKIFEIYEKKICKIPSIYVQIRSADLVRLKSF